MDTESAGRLLAENIKTVFGFSVSKLQNETEAQELASRIVYKVLKSASKLRNDDSFFAFMWRISETVYADYLREKRKMPVRIYPTCSILMTAGRQPTRLFSAKICGCSDASFHFFLRNSDAQP